jgi:formate hydrogenlyase transcriptional activator
MFRIFGVDPREGIPVRETMGRRIHPEDWNRAHSGFEKSLKEKVDTSDEYRFVLPDGTVKHIHAIRHPVVNAAGVVVELMGSFRDITEHKRAEEALRESETRFRTFVDHAGDALFVQDFEQGTIVDVNRQACESLGYTRQELIGDTAAAFHTDSDRVEMESAAERAAAGETVFDRHLHRRKDGSTFPVEVHTSLFSYGGRRFLLNVARDISDRVRAEEKLRQDEMELRQIVDAVPQHLFVLEPDGRFRYANRRDLEYTGLTLEEVLAQEFLARAWHPDDLQRHLHERQNAIAQGIPWESEVRLLGKDGQYRWFLIRLNPLRDEQGRVIRWYGTRIDIQRRKQAEDKVQQSEGELRQILNLAPQVVVVLQPDGRISYANEVMLQYTGLTLEDVRAEDFRSRVFHPDDVERVREERQNALSRSVPFENEQRMLGKDGKYCWFFFRYNPLHDAEGRVVRWYASGTDVEDRKQAEERLQHENVVLREEIDKTSMFEEIVGTSAALQTVLSRVSKVAPTDSTVLITGETGTGKELVARAIHRRSHRSSRAFVSVNCAGIPRDLIASELFGHEKGAFTGATQQRLGRFELAGGGTIFLDEVGELPAETQIALLRVLQEHEFERVGGTRPIHADVRVIAATNRDLRAAIAAGAFRDDLFYRLNVFPIEMPPLRERKQDIPLLVEYFIDRFARKAGKSIRRINKETLDLLQSYPWPGNIRELQNVIERSVIVCETEIFSVDQSWLSRQPLATEPKSSLDLIEKLAAQEKEIIEAALRECGGRVFGPSGAAVRLGMPRSTLESKIRSLKINKNRFKSAASSENS